MSRAGLAAVHVEPSPLDVAAHHVDATVGRVAVARGEIVERRDLPVAVLVFALAGEEDLLAGLPLQLVDVCLVRRRSCDAAPCP
jgi:hypothetical protein